ncbi:DUF3237 domain-containing protein [Dongia mobilis]|nr:DUF3237 domain-containing protein [Dongia mobilis]
MPGLAAAMVIDVELGPEQDLGRGEGGQRIDYPISGGHFSALDPAGYALEGTVLAGGADQFLMRDDGIGVLDARYRLAGSNGSIVEIHNRGLWVPDARGRARLAAGEEPRPEELYCRCTPVFTAPEGPFAWLNAHVFTGRVDYPAFRRVVISVYRLL